MARKMLPILSILQLIVAGERKMLQHWQRLGWLANSARACCRCWYCCRLAAAVLHSCQQPVRVRQPPTTEAGTGGTAPKSRPGPPCWRHY